MRSNRPGDRVDSNHRAESGRLEMGGTKIPTMFYYIFESVHDA